MQHSSHSLDYGSVDQLLPLLDDRLLVGQVAKKGSTSRQVSVLSSWMEAWNILHSDCACSWAGEVPTHHLPALRTRWRSLEVWQLFWQAAAMHKLHNLRWDVLKEDVLVWCVTHQPFHAWQQPVPSRLTTTLAGTTPPSGAHGASHPQVLGPRLWWRALCQGLAMRCTSGPVISSEFTPFYDQLSHTTLQLTPLYNTLTLTTIYAFTLTRPGLPGCLTALAYTDSVSPLKSCNLSTAYINPHTYTHTHTHTHYTYTYIHVAQTITL